MPSLSGKALAHSYASGWFQKSSNNDMPTASPNSYECLEEKLVVFDQLGGGTELDDALLQITRILDGRVGGCSLAARGAKPWRNLRAFALLLRFDRDGTRPDVYEARSIVEDVIAATQPRTSTYTQAMFLLGRTWEAEYRHYGSTDALDRSWKAFHTARLSAVNDMSGNSAIFLDGLDTMLGWILTWHIPFIRRGGDLSEAIELLAGVVKRTPYPDPWRALSLAILSRAYRWQWHLTGCSNKALLMTSTTIIREAVALARETNHRRRHCMLHMLSSTLQDRFDSGDGVETLHEAVTVAEEAVQILLKKRPNIVRFEDRNVLQTLSMACFTLSAAEGRLSDLDRAIQYQRIATETDTEDEPPQYYVYLMIFLSFRFRIAARLVDIDDAIKVGLKAVDRTMPESLQVEMTVGNLGCAYALRFIHGGDRTDFEAAKLYLENAVARCRSNPCSVGVLPCALRALASIHDVQYEVSGLQVDIDAAVRYGREAVAEQGENWEKPSFSSELGRYLSKRYELAGDVRDLEEAIFHAELALRTVSPAFSEKHMILWRYGHALRLRYTLRPNEHDFDMSVKALKEAFILGRKVAHLKQTSCLAQIGAIFNTRYKLYQNPEDLNLSLRYYAVSYAIPEGFIDDRFGSAVTLARLAQAHGRSLEAVKAFSAAISLLPRIAWLGMNSSRRHAKLVSTASQLACDAAASAISAGQPERAVELLEEGRSVLWRSMMELRMDLSGLENVKPRLARELVLVAQSLEYDCLSHTKLSERQLEERAQHRRRTAERWEALVEEVRKVPGFESFLKPLPFSELRKAAQDGPIVLLNVSQYRSDALIIPPGNKGVVRCVPLTGLGFSTVQQLTVVFSRALRIERDKQGCVFIEQLLRAVAGRLWYGGLGKVADALRQDRRAEEPFRVWWIPTGLLSLLPIHCAGPYEVGFRKGVEGVTVDADGKGIPDLFISSYTTTLSALLAARTRSSPPSTPRTPRILGISQPSAPGNLPLPAAGIEMQVLASTRNAPHTSFLTSSSATLSRVTSALQASDWVHFCSHGHWDTSCPLQSSIHLFDGQLTLAQLVSLHLTHADFAFLSACHTARHSSLLPDESMHLAAGMQIAGFKGLVATRWAMADLDGPVLAWRFYEALGEGGRKWEVERTAEAMWKAIRRLRAEGMPLFRWGAFVHIGI